MRFRQPSYREARRLWYVKLGGRQINLGPDEKEAPIDAGFCVVVVDQFLGWL